MSRKRWMTREVLVAVWLVLAYGFLWMRLPGFWRSPFQRYEEAQRLEQAGRDADAEAEMAMALDEEPDNAGYRVYQGNLQLRLDRPAAAEASFRAALQQRPDAEASLGLARALASRPAEARAVLIELRTADLSAGQQYRRLAALAALGDFTAALAAVDPLTSSLSADERREVLRWAMAANDWKRAEPLARALEGEVANLRERADVRVQRAIALRGLGDADAALAIFDEHPDAATLVPRAELSLQLGRFSQAAVLYRDVVAAAPDDVQARMALAYALERSGRLADAATVYDAALADGGTSARLKLATLLTVLKRYNDAWHTLEPLPQPSPDPATLRLQARTALWAGRLATSANLFATLDTRTADDDAVEAQLAGALTATGRAEDADRIYERQLSRDRLQRDARLAYADSLTARQRFDDAWRVLETIRPVDDELVGRRARVAFWGGRYAVASPLLASWLSRHPMDVERWRDAVETARQLREPAQEAEALRSYLGLRPDDQPAAVRLAGLLEQGGQIDQALEVYRQAIEREGQRADLLRIAGHLAERSGRRADAIGFYTRAWESSEPRDADLAVTIARLYRPQAPGDALTWYTRAGSAKVGADERRQLLLEVIGSEIAAGRLDQAAARIEAMVRDDDNADGRIAAATIEAARGNAAAAARHLRRVAELRALTTDERRWLGGQLRLAGDAPGALAEYERIVADAGATAADFEAAGNLRVETGNPTGALEAFVAARRLGAAPSAELAFARLLASIGRFADAVDAYARYLKGGDPTGKRVELARAHLAAARFQDAERWAYEAAQGDERGPEADLVLAQALYLNGRRRESDAVVAGLPEELPRSASVFSQAGQLAAARDRHLQGIRWFDQALTLSPSPPNAGELYYWQGVSALKRGDYARALERLERARLAGALPELERLARLEARRQSTPTLWLPFRVSDDSNGLTMRQAGIGVTTWPGRRFPLSLEAVSGALRQQDVSFDRARVVGGVGRALVSPRVGLSGYAGTERYDGRDARFVGGAGASIDFEDRSMLRVDVRRDSIWTERDRRDPRQFTRAVQLAALGPDFMVRGAELTLDKTLGTGREARLQFGVNQFQDGNLQGLLYGHYQFVLDDRPGIWTAFRPNLYWETFDRRTPDYFSPDGFTAVGGMWHGIFSSPAWRFEAEVNPRLTWLDGRASYGLHGVLDLSRAFGPVSAGVGAFTFYDRRSDYWAWRLAVQAGIRLGR